MTVLRNAFLLSGVVGDRLVETSPPPVSELLTMLRDGQLWGDVCIYPSVGQFPRANVSFHEGHGFVIQCYEDEGSWSDFLVSTTMMSSPCVATQLGGQGVERWPPELFVSEPMAAEALEYFLDNGKETGSLHWVRIDEFARLK